MNTTLKDLIDKVTSGDIPAAAMAAAGIGLLLLTLKLTRGFNRMILVWVAVALLAGAAWWHFSHKH